MTESTSFFDTVSALPGPILVLGASGFIGANLFRQTLAVREDVYGTVFRGPAWRLEETPARHLHYLNLLDPAGIESLLSKIQPQVIFNCTAYGAYSFETDQERIYRTDFLALVDLLELLADRDITAFVHAGSSSEYGLNASAPDEESHPRPNSHYSVAKSAASKLLQYYGKLRGLPCANLRLYSVYGPYEDSSRLVPALMVQGLNGALPPLVSPDTARDFVHVNDACEAFVLAASAMKPDCFGDSFNIGTGRKTTIREIAELTRALFSIDAQPSFGSMNSRAWDLDEWYANPARAFQRLGWRASTTLEEGLRDTAQWWSGYLEGHSISKLTKRLAPSGTKRSITAVIACYKDGQAIPIMYERLVAVFETLGIDYEIIFVNDNSPDDSAERIRELSHRDARVIGIGHSRNFGSQAAFRSGMEMATREACVLLDGDLQDPPELLQQFVAKWREGYDVVYGRRVRREMNLLQGLMYKAFYRVFGLLSYIPIPRDAGDFSLIDQRVVRWLLSCPERDSFLRGLRAYVGFRQTGVDYVRPRRQFGHSTNSILKNLGWAKKGIFSFSHVPLNLLTVIGSSLLAISLLLSLITIVAKLVFPELAPRGITTLLLLVMFFGSINLFGLGILGEYLGKIIVEVKGRPSFIRASLISGGRIHDLTGED